jgi:hypothetical protein
MTGPPLAGHVINVSTTGVEVAPAADLVRGTALTIRMSLPGSPTRLEVVGRVVRKTPAGIALEFVALPRLAAGRIRDLTLPWEARRRGLRVSATVPVLVDRGSGGWIRGQSRDLSLFGARVALPSAVEPGESVTLEVSPPGGPLRLPAIVWDTGARGVILMFANLTRPAFERLGAWLQTLGARPA